MTMQDPIADMLTRIRNALMRHKLEVRVSASNLNRGVLSVMQEEGYIEGFLEETEDSIPYLLVTLRYSDGEPAIRELRRISKPSVRRYFQVGDIPRIRGGLGLVVMSTNKGVISSRKARELGIGGEALCSLF